MSSPQHVFDVGAGASSTELLGDVGSSVAQMHALGLPVLPGFTVSGGGWEPAADGRHELPADVAEEVGAAIGRLELAVGRRLGDPDEPLLLAVRRGRPDPDRNVNLVLNVGLCETVRDALAERHPPELVWTGYERLLRRFGMLAGGLTRREIVQLGDGLSGADARWRARRWQAILRDHGVALPGSARGQLDAVIAALGDDGAAGAGAVTVQAMAYGGMGEVAATGVAFSRDPVSGVPAARGALYASSAAGIDADVLGASELSALPAGGPAARAQVDQALLLVEAAERDMCEIDFAIVREQPWLLRARVGRRSGLAAIRIATDLVDDGLIDVETAIERVPLQALAHLQRPVVPRGQALDAVAAGVGASGGAAVGRAVFDPVEAWRLAEGGEPAILVVGPGTAFEPADLRVAAGLVTTAGVDVPGLVHAAWRHGVPAVWSVEGAEVDAAAGRLGVGGRVVSRADVVTVDGDGGVIAAGAAPLVAPQPDPRVSRFLTWVEERRRVPVATAVPDGFAVVARIADLDAVDALQPVAYVCDAPWSSTALARLVEAGIERFGAARELALVLSAPLLGTDLRPPVARWTRVVAPSEGTWAAGLLSARIRRM